MAEQDDEQQAKSQARDWQSIFAQWAQSQETQAAFCKARGIRFAQFAYWRKKFSAEARRSRDDLCEMHQPVIKKAFAEVNMKQSGVRPNSEIVISLPNGIKLSFPDTIETGLLKTLFGLIGVSQC